MILFVDTETTGLPRDYRSPSSDTANWPHMVTISWLVMADADKTIAARNYIRRPDGFDIPEQASAIHGVTTEIAREQGVCVDDILGRLLLDLRYCDTVVAHNAAFDQAIIEAEFHRRGSPVRPVFERTKIECTMQIGTIVCKIPGRYSGFKWPNLTELHQHLFGEGIADQHTSTADVLACAKCYWKMRNDHAQAKRISPTKVALENGRDH